MNNSTFLHINFTVWLHGLENLELRCQKTHLGEYFMNATNYKLSVNNRKPHNYLSSTVVSSNTDMIIRSGSTNYLRGNVVRL